MLNSIPEKCIFWGKVDGTYRLATSDIVITDDDITKDTLPSFQYSLVMDAVGLMYRANYPTVTRDEVERVCAMFGISLLNEAEI